MLTIERPRPVATVAVVAGVATVAGVAEENDLLLARLINAAMRACDHHGDGPQARAQMRQDCIDTPAQLRADLLQHFREAYK